jgi:hypothetical protein
MRGFRHIVRLLLVALLICTLAPPLAAVSLHATADHVHVTEEPGLPGSHDAAGHTITDHVHEAVTVRLAHLAPCWMPQARPMGPGQEDLAPAPRGKMERPPRRLG